MNVSGHIEPVSRELSHDVWQDVIAEMPQLQPRRNDPEYAYLTKRGDNIGAFQWKPEEDEITVLGELDTVRGIAEQIATRIGGRFVPSM
ncbi:MAG: hypothetical protein ACR2NP_04010 [Pirellulaceae bacterium]